MNIYDVYSEFYKKFHIFFPFIFMASPNSICVDNSSFDENDIIKFNKFFLDCHYDSYYHFFVYDSHIRLIFIIKSL